MNTVWNIGKDRVYSSQVNKLLVGYWKHLRRDHHFLRMPPYIGEYELKDP